MIVLQTPPQILGLYPATNETTKQFLCRIITWMFEQEDLIDKLPWYIPVSLVKMALTKMLGCKG